MKRMGIEGMGRSMGHCHGGGDIPFRRLPRPLGGGVSSRTASCARLHGHRFPPYKVVEIGVGEAVKTLATVETVYEGPLNSGVDRSSWMIGIGGGLVCDVAGFAASTYLRGFASDLCPPPSLPRWTLAWAGKTASTTADTRTS